MEIKFTWVWEESEFCRGFNEVSSFEECGEAVFCNFVRSNGDKASIGLKHLHESVPDIYYIFMISCEEELTLKKSTSPLTFGNYVLSNGEFETSDFDSLESFESKINKIIKEHMVGG